jgi:hypothetical protein
MQLGQVEQLPARWPVFAAQRDPSQPDSRLQAFVLQREQPAANQERPMPLRASSTQTSFIPVASQYYESGRDMRKIIAKINWYRRNSSLICDQWTKMTNAQSGNWQAEMPLICVETHARSFNC